MKRMVITLVLAMILVIWVTLYDAYGLIKACLLTILISLRGVNYAPPSG